MGLEHILQVAAGKSSMMLRGHMIFWGRLLSLNTFYSFLHWRGENGQLMLVVAEGDQDFGF